MQISSFLQLSENGLYCPQADFYIDPWKPVPKAIITHGHADHARWGCKYYLASLDSKYILKTRLGDSIHLETLPFYESKNINNVKFTFFPAGHILGSAQIKLEYKGEVVVVSGDYKNENDPTANPFEPVSCHTFITESTFGLPVYKWKTQKQIFNEINSWWKKNADNNITSVLFAYALGKAQRLIAGVDSAVGAIFTHGAVEKMNDCYRRTGVNLPETHYVGSISDKEQFSKALVIAPPSADTAPWLKRFGQYSRAFASGWMQLRGSRRRRNVDRGFVLSDHADWNGLIDTIKATKSEKVLVTHGYSLPLVRYLREMGLEADVLQTVYEGEPEDSDI